VSPVTIFTKQLSPSLDPTTSPRHSVTHPAVHTAPQVEPLRPRFRRAFPSDPPCGTVRAKHPLAPQLDPFSAPQRKNTGENQSPPGSWNSIIG